MPVDARSRYTKNTGDLTHIGPIGEHDGGSSPLLLAPHRRSPESHTTSACSSKTASRALSNELTLEFCECGEYPQCQPTCGRSRVDVLVKRPKRYPPRTQTIDSRYEMRERTAQPVETPDDEDIAPPDDAEDLT